MHKIAIITSTWNNLNEHFTKKTNNNNKKRHESSYAYMT